MKIDRRDFVKRSGTFLVMTSAAATAWDHVMAGTPENSPNYRLTDHWWAMAIDIDKCIGCGNCVRACKVENDVPREPYYFRTWVERYHVQVCPVGATFDGPDGVVLVDKSYCLGCRYCVQACPYGCRFIDPRTNTVDKCSLCYHRITRGLTTACCETCPTGARRLGDLKDVRDPIHEFLRTHKVQVLKPQMATGSKMYYSGLDGSVR
ncbi:MAG: 4Fe-4S ferredoxin, iron-sulfur binding domain protein [Acidobacteria bacterium]|nr:4Fe-4S ferredoxin, iron-sulfur binding domain protein [Acidobacteriota bacterium]